MTARPSVTPPLDHAHDLPGDAPVARRPDGDDRRAGVGPRIADRPAGPAWSGVRSRRHPGHRLPAAGLLVSAVAGVGLVDGPAVAQSRTLVGQSVATQPMRSQDRDPHLFYDLSIFAVNEGRPRVFRPHDLVQIIVQERSRSSSSQELETGKEFGLDGSISAFPQLSLSDIAQLQLMAGRTANLPEVGVDLGNEFTGEGEYSREDDFSTRLAAEVVEVLPNGNIVLEARTSVRNDDEVSVITVTGVCRGEDVTTGNTVLSNQIHDLRVDKRNEGRLPEANRKGIVTQFFEFLFAF